MLKIRLFRVGKKHQPSYKIVVTDKRKAPAGGRFVDEVGFYNPNTKEKMLKAEKIKEWISKGAQPSDTVHNLLVSEKIVKGGKISVHKKSKKKPVEGQNSQTDKKEEKKEELKPEEKPVEEPKAEEKTEKPEKIDKKS